MKRKCITRGKYILLLLLTSAILFMSLSHTSVLADDHDPTDRIITLQTKGVLYEWRLIFWSDNMVACDLLIDHQGNPTDDEIRQKCSQQLFNMWTATPACNNSEKCTGLYLQYNISTSINDEIQVEVPLPSVRLSLSGCEYYGDADFCSGSPSLMFTGQEPLPDAEITRIYGVIGSEEFSCQSNFCTVPLPITGTNGIPITFNADSSHGDSSPDYTAYARVINDPAQSGSYTIDVASSQWDGKPAPACSSVWQVFPESSVSPDWLRTPQDSAEFESSLKLYYLAAQLINNGLVDASMCENYGLESSTIANECGVQVAESETQKWQNQFDKTILADAAIANIPATLMKNLILRESQFWPGVYPGDVETGLAHITMNGADTLLLWNKSFYDQFCPVVFYSSVCTNGYALLGEEKQDTLKGALLQRVNAACADCNAGMDASKGDYAIFVLSEALNANCAQVDQLITNITDQPAREVSNYTDLWRFTLVNYNAGAGCLGSAITRTWKEDSPLDWMQVAANLDPACQGAVDYVIDISNGKTIDIPVFSTMLPTNASEPTQSPTPTTTSTPTLTPTITATPTETPTLTATEDLGG